MLLLVESKNIKLLILLMRTGRITVEQIEKKLEEIVEKAEAAIPKNIHTLSMKTWKENLNLLRQIHKKSLDSLSLDCNISRETLRHYVHGSSIPSGINIVKIAAVLDTTAEVMFSKNLKTKKKIVIECYPN
jgi:response regulator of citrate/malate metabolism